MDTDVKNKWVTALRSGQYLQGKGGLRIKGQPGDEHADDEGTDRFCCLGVLCDVVGVEWVYEPGMVGKFQAMYQSSEEVSYPPSPLCHEVGLDPAKQLEILTELNDDHDYTFEHIATWIEDNL